MPRSDARLRPLEAWRALQRLFADPDDTAAVFEIIDALPGRSGERAYRRFAASAVGQKVLRADRELLDVLNDREALLTLAEGSFGRSYAEFTAAEQISADGLVAASQGDGTLQPDPDPGARRFFNRLRDSHDLEHVVSGFGRDLRGEGALLALGLAQIWTPGIALIVGMAWLRGDREERRILRDGFRRGRRAAWLAGVDWEALLPLPLEEVRRRLRLDPPPVYEAVRSEGAPALA